MITRMAILSLDNLASIMNYDYLLESPFGINHKVRTTFILVRAVGHWPIVIDDLEV
jgi:hypothetical protein